MSATPNPVIVSCGVLAIDVDSSLHILIQKKNILIQPESKPPCIGRPEIVDSFDFLSFSILNNNQIHFDLIYACVLHGAAR